MKNYEDMIEVKQAVSSITCDCCGVTHTDIYEIQEFLSWEDTCGYGNRMFGDLNKVELDLCQVCTFELLGKYVRVTEQNF